MSRKDDLRVLYTPPRPEIRQQVFNMIQPHMDMYSLLSVQDIQQLNAIARSKKLSAKPVDKLNMIKYIMANRGFKRLASGTNRIVFKYMEDQSIVIKVAYDQVGLSDNLMELHNQYYLMPYCCKVFQVSPCGTVGMFERVIPIQNRKEFELIANDVFDIIVSNFVGRYILNDFGTQFFMNWGMRKNMHPVLLDFPYVFELDGAKLYCNKKDPNSETGYCLGEIDYDEGFNFIRCNKCHKTYRATELKMAAEKKTKDIIIDKEELNMLIRVMRGDEVIQESDRANGTKVYRTDAKGRRKETPIEYNDRKRFEKFTIVVNRVDVEPVQAPISQLVSAAAVDNTPDIHDYDAALFNRSFTLDDVPMIDEKYKRTIVLKDHDGKVVNNEVEDNTIKDMIDDTVARQLALDSQVVESSREEEYHDESTHDTSESNEDRASTNDYEKLSDVSGDEIGDYRDTSDGPAIAEDNPFDTDPELRARVENMIEIIPREIPPEVREDLNLDDY